MRVAMYYSNSDVRIEEMPRPEIGPDELLVKVRACGICGSDVMEWYRKARAPLVLGHELAGDVVEAGRDVDRFRSGDRVAVTHHVPCNTCHHCLAGHHSVCHTLRTTSFHPGGFSEYLRVPAINVDRGTLPLPDSMSYHQGAFLEPLGCVYRGQRLAGFRPGMSALILGSGVTGLLFVKLLKALGAGTIATTDISGFKLEKAREFGADHAWPVTHDVPGGFRQVNGGKLPDLVVVCTGDPSAIATAFQAVGPGGTILFFASPGSGDGDRVTFPLARLWKDEVTMITSYAASPHDLGTAMELIRAGRVRVEDMITHRLPLERTGVGFQLAARAQESLKIIIEPHG